MSLTRSQRAALEALNVNKSLTVDEHAVLTGKSRGAVSSVLEELQGLGLVKFGTPPHIGKWQITVAGIKAVRAEP